MNPISFSGVTKGYAITQDGKKHKFKFANKKEYQIIGINPKSISNNNKPVISSSSKFDEVVITSSSKDRLFFDNADATIEKMKNSAVTTKGNSNLVVDSYENTKNKPLDAVFTILDKSKVMFKDAQKVLAVSSNSPEAPQSFKLFSLKSPIEIESEENSATLGIGGGGAGAWDIKAGTQNPFTISGNDVTIKAMGENEADIQVDDNAIEFVQSKKYI